MRGCKARYSALDADIYKFLGDERCAGRSVSNKQLMAKALEIAPKLNIPGRFKGSCMWLKRWKLRNRVSLHTVKKKGVATTHLGVFVRLFRNNTPWSVVVTAQECYSQHP